MAERARLWTAVAGVNGLLAVAAGAFAAHGVSDPIAKELLRTGAQYQLAHAVAAVAVLAMAERMRLAAIIAGLFGAGSLLFGGSLYLLAFTGQRWPGPITPLGGVLMFAGWATLIWSALKAYRSSQQRA